MGIFKSQEEKRLDEESKAKENWSDTFGKLGISYDGACKTQKLFQKALIDATDEIGLITNVDVINKLFSDLTPIQKYLIMLYASWNNTIKHL